MDKVHLEGTEARASSPEGNSAEMPLEKLMDSVTARTLDSGEFILPDGVNAVRSEGPVTIVVHETPPRVHSFKWIASDSPRPYGSGAKYREVAIALPYLVTLIVFRHGLGAPLTLTELNECFFRTAPLESLEDELFYPALLNCSKFTPPDGKPLAWICTQHLNFAAVNRDAPPARRLRAGFCALMHCLLEAGSNYSSEHHEGASWFTESRGVDPRVSSVERWQEATAADTLFVLEVPWLKTGYSLQGVLQRIFHNLGAGNRAPWTSAALARIIFNHKSTGPQPAKKP